MSQPFSILPFRKLVKIVLNHLDNKRSFFNIPQEVFFNPKSDDPFRMMRFGQLLETPVGTAAGPHTQLTQNIVAAWLCGARYIELKTIQTLDNLEVSKPCIDMQDEGYNCEWSQELKITESFDQYLNAWILVHLLKEKLGHPFEKSPGTVFNMSIGYNLNGILQENVQWFLSQMKDCSIPKSMKIAEIEDIYPNIRKIEIPDCISDNVTLSTMHGCPPGEIEKIGSYLIEERKLNTIIKLNPTLLGKSELNSHIEKSGFHTIVPDEAYEHDLKYPDALKIIRNLQQAAHVNHVHFGIKLTNTLESLNNKTVFSPAEKTMYMSGRPLHPIAVSLAARLQNDFDGKLDISFSAGVNAFNLPKVISSGLKPATVCSDLLKPGGYGLLNQYLKNLSAQMEVSGAQNIEDYILKTLGNNNLTAGILQNLGTYAKEVMHERAYLQTRVHRPDIKTERQLGAFDCIHAPCVDTCPAHQDIPGYMHFTANGNLHFAFDAIFATNPFPNTTGMICDQTCRDKCTRVNYDDPLQIREIKRYVAENFSAPGTQTKTTSNGKTVAIIGAGPSGLACAYYLNLAGFRVEVFEAKSVAGGMVEELIPEFRLNHDSLQKDLDRIEKSGVQIYYNSKIDKQRFSKLQHEFDFIYVSTGAWSTRKFIIEGINAEGVIDPIKFLARVKNGNSGSIGKNIVVIGGGNTAMDAARTALRVSGKSGKVTILYRRSLDLMPADQEEIKAVQDEGIKIIDLSLPVKINTLNNSVISLTCVKIRLVQQLGNARPRPVEIPDSEFEFECDTVIPAIGQDAAFEFMDDELAKTIITPSGSPNQKIFIGGDAKRGGSTVIQAIADGRMSAELMIKKSEKWVDDYLTDNRHGEGFQNLMIKRMYRQMAVKIPETPLTDRKNFRLVNGTLTAEQAQAEASRCLQCDVLCNSCVTVCPNLAFYSYTVEPIRLGLQKITILNDLPLVEEDSIFTLTQPYQVLHIADWCNECGNCTTFCPTTDAPYLKKPHLYLNREAFEACDNGYFYETETQTLLYKQKNRRYSIFRSADNYQFTDGDSAVILESTTFRIAQFKLKGTKTINLKVAAEMSVILAGAKEFWNNK